MLLIQAIVFKTKTFVYLTHKSICKNRSTLFNRNSGANSRVTHDKMCLENRFSYITRVVCTSQFTSFTNNKTPFDGFRYYFHLLDSFWFLGLRGKNRERRSWCVFVDAMNIKLIVEHAHFVIKRLFSHPLMSSATGKRMYNIHYKQYNRFCVVTIK